MDLQKKDIDHLAELARIEISDVEKDKIFHDLKGILGYVEKLRSVNTEGVAPMVGGAIHANDYRADEGGVLVSTPAEDLRRAFPDRQDDYLKVPHVFE